MTLSLELGHQDAWEKAGVLHHDVSPGNILINIYNGEAFMNDWDLAKYREDLENGVEAAEPAGVSVRFRGLQLSVVSRVD